MNNKIINRAYISLLILVSIVFLLSVTFPADVLAGESTKKPIHKKIAYIVSDIRIPFWDIMGRGIKSKAQSLGYDLTIYSAENSAKKELQSVIRALKEFLCMRDYFKTSQKSQNPRCNIRYRNG